MSELSDADFLREVERLLKQGALMGSPRTLAIADRLETLERRCADAESSYHRIHKERVDEYERAERLERENARLREALEPLAGIQLEAFEGPIRHDHPLMGWNDHMLYVRDVFAARKALEKP